MAPPFTPPPLFAAHIDFPFLPAVYRLVWIMDYWQLQAEKNTG